MSAASGLGSSRVQSKGKSSRAGAPGHAELGPSILGPEDDVAGPIASGAITCRPFRLAASTAHCSARGSWSKRQTRAQPVGWHEETILCPSADLLHGAQAPDTMTLTHLAGPQQFQPCPGHTQGRPGSFQRGQARPIRRLPPGQRARRRTSTDPCAPDQRQYSGP